MCPNLEMMSWFKTTKVYSVINNKCPKCHEGDMFLTKNPYDIKNMDKMPDNCPVCGQKYVLEPMFYTGAMYASYAITIAFSVATFIITYTFTDIAIHWYLAINAAVLVLTIPLSFRWARTMWINFFVHYDENAANKTAMPQKH